MDEQMDTDPYLRVRDLFVGKKIMDLSSEFL